MSARESEIRGRFGANLAESLGANRRPPDAQVVPPSSGATRLKSAATIDLDRVIPDPEQPRKEFDPDELARLAASLATHGQILPITVRRDEGRGVYVITTGERRWRAARMAGLKSIAAIVDEGERTAAQILEIQLLENLMREDLKPMDQARAFRQLIDINGWTAKDLAGAIHASEAQVSRSLSLLDLPASLAEAVEAGGVSASVAYEVNLVADESEREHLSRLAIEGVLTRTEARKARRPDPPSGPRGPRSASRPKEESIRLAGGLVVVVRKGRGLAPGDVESALEAALEAVRNARFSGQK